MDGTAWADIVNTATTYTSGALTQTTSFRAVVTSGVCSSATSTPTTITVNAVSVGGTVSGTSSVCSGTNNTTLTLTGNNGTISKWQSSTTADFSGVVTDIVNSTSVITVTNLTATTYYRAVVINGVCSSANSSVVSITVNSLPVVSINPSFTEITIGATANLAVGGANTYSWSPTTGLSATNTAIVTATPTADIVYTVTGTNNNGCSSTATSTVKVNPVLFAGGISTDQTICSGITPAAFSSNSPATGGTGTIIYQWQQSTDNITFSDIPAATALTYASASLTQTTYYRRGAKTANDAIAYTGSLKVTVQSSVGGSISGSTAVCANTNNTPLSLSGITGNVIKWQSSTSADFSTSVTDIVNTTTSLSSSNLTATTYYRAVVQIGSCPAANSSTATITVNQLPVVSITPTAVAIVIGNSTMLTASGANSYQWTPSTALSASNAANVSADPTSTITYLVTGTTATNCSASQSVTVTVNPRLVAGTIAADQTICTGNIPASFTSTIDASGGTSAIVYQWQQSSDNISFSNIVGTVSATYTPGALTATTYFRRGASTSNESSVYSGSVVVIVQSSVGGTITGTGSVCSGTNNTSLSLIGITGSVQKWQSSTTSDFSASVTDINNITTSLTASNLTATTYYRAVIGVGSCPAANSSTSVVTVNAVPSVSVSPNITIAAGANTALTSTGAANYSWTPSTGLSAINTATVTANPSATTTYTVIGTTANGCTSSASVTVTVTPNPAILSPGVIGNDQEICSGTIPVTLQSKPNAAGGDATGGTGTIGYQWQTSTDNINFTNIAGATASSYSPSALTQTTYYRRAATDNNGTAYTGSVKVAVKQSQGGTISGGATVCVGINNTPLSLSGYTGTILKWQSSSSADFSTGVSDINNTTAAITISNINATTYYRAVIQDGSCPSVSSASATITGVTAPVVTISPTTFTIPAGSSTTISVNGNADSYLWTPSTALSSTTGSTVTANPTSSITYTVTGTKTVGGCTNSASASVKVVLILSTGSIAADQTICTGSAPVSFTSTMSAIGGTGTIGYQWQQSTNNITFTDIAGAKNETYSPGVLTQTTYYRRGASTTTDPVVYTGSVTVTIQSAVGGTISGSAVVCAGTNNIPLSVSGIAGNVVKWQSSSSVDFSTGVTDIANTTTSLSAVNLNTTTYYRAFVQVGSCPAVNSSTVTVTVNPLPLVTVSPSTVNIVSGASAVLTASGATSYSWVPSTALSATNTLSVTANPAGTTTYIVTGTNTTTGCTNTASVVISISQALTPGAIGSNRTLCTGSITTTFTSTTTASGGTGTITYQWQSSTVSATAGFVDIAGATATTYAPSGAFTQTTYFRRGAKTTVDVIFYTTAITVTVNPLPTVTVTPASVTITSGMSTTLTASGANTYAWSPATGLSSTVTAVVTASPVTTTIYTVTGTSAAGCGNTTTATVTINGVIIPLTPGTIAVDQTICSGSTASGFTSSSSAVGGTGSITYQWQQSTNNVNFTNIPGATSATYAAGALTQTTYYRRAASTSTDAAVFAGPVTVTVKNPPVIGAISGPCAMPKDSTKTFSVTAVLNATSYVWTLPNGWTGTSTANSINATANNTGGTISVTAFNGTCQGNTITYQPSVIDYTNVTITGLPVVASGNNNSAITITVTLYDVNGNKINCSGGVASVYTCDNNPGTFTTVVDNNDGTYTTLLTASANDITICGSVGGVLVLKRSKVTFTGPQGGIKPNGPIFDFETPKLTFTATAGRAPFTIIYRSAKSNKNDTVTNITSGTAISVALIPSTTLYTLVSIIDANGERRDNNFNRDTATVIVVSPKVIITLKADPAKQEKDSSWATRLVVKTKNIGDIDLTGSQARLNLNNVFPSPVTYVLDSVTYSGNTISPNRKYEGVQNTDLFARVNTRKPDVYAKATVENLYTNAYENTIPQSPDGSASVEIWGSTNKTDQAGNQETFTVTDEGDGSYMFGALSNLPVGVEADIILYLHVRPNGYTDPFVIQAVALGTGVTVGATSLASSLSNDNNDINAHPEITNQGDPVPTVINLFPRAVIGAALSASTPVLQGNGTYNVLFSVKVKNYGNINLTSVKLNLDLLKSIGLPSTFTLVGPVTATGSMIPNPLYNGKTDTSLLTAGNTLGYKQESVLQFTINITPNKLSSVYNLQATASGYSEELSTTATDLSNNGTDPDPDGNGTPSEKIITQIIINVPVPPLIAGTIGIQTGPTTTVAAKSYCGPTFGVVIIPTSLNSGGLNAYQYQWQSSADNISFQDIDVAADSTFTSGQVNNSFYLRRGTISGSQIKYSNSVYIQIFPITKPTITASGPLVLTQNGNIILSSSAANSYVWSTGAVTKNITVTLAGKYTVSTVDVNVCSAVSDTVKVYPPPPVTVNATYIIGAINNPVNSGVQVTGLPGATLNYYILSTGGTLIPVPVLPGVVGVFTYYVSQTVNGFESILVPYTVTMIDKVSDVQKVLPKAPVLQSDGSFLLGFTILSTNLRNELLDSVKIKDDLTKVFPASSQFQVVDIKASGKLIANLLYNGNSQIELLNDGSQLPGLKTDSVNLTIKMIPNGFSGTLNNVAIQTAKSPYGIFRVTSNDPKVGNGIAVREPTKFVIPIIDIFIPSGFSPNQDGSNDKFVIIKPFNTTISLDVFNRWGNLVFKAQDYKNEFDGKGNQLNRVLGEDLPDGTYYYIVVATNNSNGTIRKFAGFITLKR